MRCFGVGWQSLDTVIVATCNHVAPPVGIAAQPDGPDRISQPSICHEPGLFIWKRNLNFLKHRLSYFFKCFSTEAKVLLGRLYHLSCLISYFKLHVTNSVKQCHLQCRVFYFTRSTEDSLIAEIKQRIFDGFHQYKLCVWKYHITVPTSLALTRCTIEIILLHSKAQKIMPRKPPQWRAWVRLPHYRESARECALIGCCSLWSWSQVAKDQTPKARRDYLQIGMSLYIYMWFNLSFQFVR
jgi:hypothetical protein